jgi:hypothetical protein
MTPMHSLTQRDTRMGSQNVQIRKTEDVRQLPHGSVSCRSMTMGTDRIKMI